MFPLDAFVSSDMPTILVSCKCDNPVETREIDMESIQAACLAEVETVKTASNAPESARLCLGAMLRAIIANRNGEFLSFHNCISSGCKGLEKFLGGDPFAWVEYFNGGCLIELERDIVIKTTLDFPTSSLLYQIIFQSSLL
jgi:hypothetical protein